MFSETFFKTGITEIPAGLFSGIDTSKSTNTSSMFEGTFLKTGITSIPAGLFSSINIGPSTDITDMFGSTFNGCNSLTEIPAGLFSSINTSTATGSYMFSSTFANTGITEIPAGLFANITTGLYGMFVGTFSGCTSLTEIPGDLFSGITTGVASMFSRTFERTGITEIPGDLFSSITTGAESMFNGTFERTGITEIPAGLFANITTVANNMFVSTFNGCTSLTEIPAGLFANITTVAQGLFANTFYSCSNLSGYIPPTTFAGLIANGSPTASNMWNETFGATKLLTTCPAGTTQYITGYEGNTRGTTWYGKVSCEPCPGTLPENATYSTANSCDWTCDTGYLQNNDVCVECSGAIYMGRCRELCPVGRAVLHAGQYAYPVFADKTDVPSPVLHIRRDENTVCYVYLEPDAGGEHGLKLRFTDNKVYHAIDPR